ncbi:MAG: tungsten ABC transporter substrate-binding protein [Clostridiales bacterium]|nr:tungsten ABC transporter substrate-binding protein [Clostridiales bacterium]
MKKLSLLLAVMMVLGLALVGCGSPAAETPTPENPVIRLSTTTSVNDSGLLPYLQPTFEGKTGYKLEITSNGTGAAIKLGESGDADCLLVHSKASEEAFVEAGFGVERIPFMFNYFVLVGPAADPAGVKDCATAIDALKAIAATEGAEFVSRGDDSGTHKAEMKIWAAAEIDPTGAAYYISAGAGMGACLNQASERGAYVLTDKATFLANKENLDLEILLEKSDEMKNTYSVIEVSAEKHPDTNTAGAKAFIEWITSDEALELIAKYGVEEYGEALFFVD